ncbi:NAD(P)-dependent glycerol-3-phosphate dehydrogenase [Glycomyces sp. L485]|uniref:NAD(P)H-dependent glycerol-3-phosphate dehydrogenase n=1 Tax=Glycomyces sp. L485 TaxID=2909235 RepID=UPI001F4B6A75|nr:NAD(P)H-dependent glycerol-3-phosphate dehydrogenase [Glycomyces sp. L485]MCH7231624.1 NAD(P)-dependent glycerol-3-phosphate dehydrogenase [Glycomyces sp. L485]
MGAGSWGTVFAKILADAGTPVTLWARRASVAAGIRDRRSNPEYFPDIRLGEAVSATDDPAEALKGAGIVVLSIPSQTLRENLAAWSDLIEPDATLLSLMKGIELGTTSRMTEVIAEVTGADPGRVAVLSGPNLAREIAEEQPTASVVACTDHDRAVAVQRAVITSYFRPYTNTDVVGCELGGATKNVIALAYGMAAGMGLGDNTKATIITRGLAETTRLGIRLGADPATFAGLAGLGDLVATCSSPLSRNHTFGEQLGLGATLEEAARVTKQTAEGVKSCRSITDLARKVGVEMPICDAVERVCHEGLDPRAAVAELMGRETKPETDTLRSNNV